MQKFGSVGGALPFYQVFNNLAKLNTTLCSERDMKWISRWSIFEALEADVSANNIVSFKVRFLLGRDLLSVQLFFMNSRTILTSQVDEYLALRGLRSKRVQISGYCPTGKPAIFSWKAEIAEPVAVYRPVLIPLFIQTSKKV